MKQITKPNTPSKSTKSRKSTLVNPVESPIELPVKTKSKIEKLEIKDYVGTNDVNVLNQNSANNEPNTTASESSSKLNKLESNVSLFTFCPIKFNLKNL